eukprot:486004-Pyramimonas_sp.AAC.1
MRPYRASLKWASHECPSTSRRPRGSGRRAGAAFPSTARRGARPRGHCAWRGAAASRQKQLSV